MLGQRTRYSEEISRKAVEDFNKRRIGLQKKLVSPINISRGWIFINTYGY